MAGDEQVTDFAGHLSLKESLDSGSPDRRSADYDSDLAVFPSEPAAAERTLVDIILETIATYPSAPAIDDGSNILDYAEFGAEIHELARKLWASDIGAGDRVGVRVPSGSKDLYVAILGIQLAGAAYVPVDADEPDERAETVWEEAEVCAVVGEDLAINHRPGIRTKGNSPNASPDDDAWIIFTSGSTGKPKGVAITHRSAAAWVDAESKMFLQHDPITRGDRVMAGLSVAFDASCEEMWLAWRNGACLVPAPRSLVRSGADLGDWLRERNVTVVSTVPTLAAMWPAETLARIRLLIFGGEALPAELVERLAGPTREVWNTYGPTEATVIACGAAVDGTGPVSIGLPLQGWDLAVVDQDGHPVPWGSEGELIIGGVGLGRYLDADKDAEKYARCRPWVGTGRIEAGTWCWPIPRACCSWAAPTNRSSSAGAGWNWVKSTRPWLRSTVWPWQPRPSNRHPAATRSWPVTWYPNRGRAGPGRVP